MNAADVTLGPAGVIANDASLMGTGLRKGYSVFLLSSVRRVVYDEY